MSAPIAARWQPLGLGDVTITEVFDPTFRADQHVAQIRIQAQERRRGDHQRG